VLSTHKERESIIPVSLFTKYTELLFIYLLVFTYEYCLLRHYSV